MVCPRVIIIGAGFGGINAAKGLKKAAVDVYIIDRTNHHLFQPLLYQVATAALSPGNIAMPIREILAHQENATVLLADIVKVEKDKNIIVAANGETFKYDYLIIAAGSRHYYFGHPEWEELAPGLKTLNDALRVRERILLSYERAERCDNITEALRFLRFVIIGAGPTGVEMAGAIAEIAQKTLVKNFRHIQPEQTKVYLIEAAGQVLPSYPKDLADKAKLDLEKLGVDVLLNAFVTSVTPQGIWMGDKFLESSNIIWAAGNEASPLIKSLDVPLDIYGRARVNPDLSIPGYPDVFVIGDAASFLDKNGKPLPAIAPFAIQEGRYVAKIIKKKIPFNQRPPFKYVDKGMMATIGKAKAVAVMGKFKLSGNLAWMAWCFIHIAYLISFSNRILVLIQWLYLYVANKRRIRLIESPISDFDDPLYKSEKK